MNLLQLFSPRKWTSKWASQCWKPIRPQRRDPQRPSVRPRLEVLEDRTLLTAYMVTLATDNNSGGQGQQDPNNANAGDIRYCLNKADAGPGNSVTFANQVNGQTIDLQAALPEITQSMTIAPAAGVNVTVERSVTAATNFRIFYIESGNKVTLGAFTIQKGFLEGTTLDEGAGILNYGNLTLNGTTVQKNQTDDDGGGIANAGTLTLIGASISTNQAKNGGGIYNGGSMSTAKGAPLLSLINNQASLNGAAIYNDNTANAILNKVLFSKNIAQEDGGGIYNNNTGNLTIQNSTFKSNQAIGGNGGGIFNDEGVANINQNTFTDNSAGLQGGAIKNSGRATGKSNTIDGNQVTGIPGALASNETGGGISNAPGAVFGLVNTIVAGNTAPTNPDVDGNFTDNGHNFIGDGTGGDFLNGVNGDQVGDSVHPLNPMLGPLQNNGGPIDTELPLAGSPVIDAGDNSQALPTDARVYIRIVNNVIDIGAVEYNSTPAPIPMVMGLSPNSGPTAGGTSVQISGSHFTGTTEVDFGDTPASSFVVQSDNSILVQSPAGAAGVVDVIVTNADGPSNISPSDQFTYLAAPSVTGINPNSGPTSGGTSVIITGSGFTGATQVGFGTVPAMMFSVTSDTSITAISPAEPRGVVDVTVTTPSGHSSTSPADQFTYTSSMSPALAHLQAGTSPAGSSATPAAHADANPHGVSQSPLGQVSPPVNLGNVSSSQEGNASLAQILANDLVLMEASIEGQWGQFLSRVSGWEPQMLDAVFLALAAER